MKLIPNNRINPEITKSDEQEKKFHKLGIHTSKVDGGKIFEYDPITDKVVEAQYQSIDTVVWYADAKCAKPSKKLVINPGMKYVEALNSKNALKHAKKFNFINTSAYNQKNKTIEL